MSVVIREPEQRIDHPTVVVPVSRSFCLDHLIGYCLKLRHPCSSSSFGVSFKQSGSIRAAWLHKLRVGSFRIRRSLGLEWHCVILWVDEIQFAPLRIFEIVVCEAVQYSFVGSYCGWTKSNLKPWDTMVCWYFQGGFLNGAAIWISGSLRTRSSQVPRRSPLRRRSAALWLGRVTGCVGWISGAWWRFVLLLFFFGRVGWGDVGGS